MSASQQVSEVAGLVGRMPERDRKTLMAVVYVMAHDPAAKTTPFADLWHLCGGEKPDAELRAKWDAIDAELRGIQN